MMVWWLICPMMVWWSSLTNPHNVWQARVLFYTQGRLPVDKRRPAVQYKQVLNLLLEASF
ncbi:Putative uncharacterized protein [Halomonas sp. R57-5]|nr:Putative uncharacterized protein [Halomonas sp. R57-5]